MGGNDGKTALNLSGVKKGFAEDDRIRGGHRTTRILGEGASTETPNGGTEGNGTNVCARHRGWGTEKT